MNTRPYSLILLVLLALLTLTGCSTGGMFLAENVTDVQLQRGNFRIVAKDVAGEAQAGYLFGGSFSVGATTSTFSLFRVSGTGMLYRDALLDLWKNFETSHGSIEGKKVALINVRYDAEALNLFVYTQPKIIVRADVVEFTD